MKKIVLVALCVLLCLSLCSCGKDTASESTAPEEETVTESADVAESKTDAETAAAETATETATEPEEKECEHDWAEANKQNPKTCKLCGETEGEKLPADFETYGIKTYAMPIGEANAMPFAFTFYGYEFSGKAYFDELQCENYSDGYAGYSASLYLVFDQQDVPSFPFGLNKESYYDIEKWDDVTEEILDGAVCEYRSVDWNGVEYDKCTAYVSPMSAAEPMGDKSVVSNMVYAEVPVGYDGVVVGFFPREVIWEEGCYVSDLYPDNAESWYMFRLDPAAFPTAE